MMQPLWIDDFAAFSACGQAWDRLHARARRASVFLSHGWLDAAWAWAQHESRPQVLLLGDLTAPSSAAALSLQTRRLGGLPWRTLGWLDVPDTQHCDFLVDEEAGGLNSSRLTEALLERRGAWDVMRLTRLQPDSFALTALRAGLEAQGVRAFVRQTDVNMYVPLVGGWTAYQTGLTRSFKKKLNLARNRLAKLGEVQVERISGAEQGPVAIAEAARALTEISARSWKQSTYTTLDRTGPRDFLERLIARFGESEQMVIWLLKLSGHVVATELQLQESGKTYALRSDFDPEFDEASPGTNLSLELLKRLFETEPGGCYLMGPGANAYKMRWTGQGLPLHELTVYSPTARGLALYALEQKVRPWARDVRDRLRKPEKQLEDPLTEH